MQPLDAVEQRLLLLAALSRVSVSMANRRAGSSRRSRGLPGTQTGNRSPSIAGAGGDGADRP
jgi:hypothetical protein